MMKHSPKPRSGVGTSPLPTTLEEYEALKLFWRGEGYAVGCLENAALRNALERARTILGNMAKENLPAIAFRWQRWPISHEPLRADARNLLPIIDTALSTSNDSGDGE